MSVTGVRVHVWLAPRVGLMGMVVVVKKDLRHTESTCCITLSSVARLSGSSDSFHLVSASFLARNGSPSVFTAVSGHDKNTSQSSAESL